MRMYYNKMILKYIPIAIGCAKYIYIQNTYDVSAYSKNITLVNIYRSYKQI